MPIEIYIILFIICVVLSFFFSSAETAFISIQKFRLEHMLSSRVKGAKRVAKIISRPEKLLSTVLLGTNLVNTTAAALITSLTISIWGSSGVWYATIGVTVILLIFAETTPKTIAHHHAERMSLLYSRPLEILSWLFTPFVLALSWVASVLSRLAGGAPVPRSLVSVEEIRTMISVGHRESTVQEHAARLLHRVFDFGERSAYEVMIPRTEVVAIEQGSTVADLLNLYLKSPLSRFPVFKDDMDNVVGIISAKDVLMALARNTVDRQSTIDDLVRPAYFTPRTKHINELFAEMRDKNYRMCVVVGEFGGTSGIISLTRLIEEIVGEVGDELFASKKGFEMIDEYTFLIDGSMRIEDANEEIGLGLPEGNYETLAGFVLDLLGRIPKEGEQVKHKRLTLTIKEMKGTKIDKILAKEDADTAAED